MIQDTQFQFSLFTWAQLLTLFFQQAVNPRAAAQSAVQPEPSFASHHTWDPSIAAMVGALFCAFLFMGFVSVYLRHCTEGYVNTAGQNQIGGSGGEWPCSCSQGIDRQVLNTFPILVYSTIKDLKIGKGSLECAVCLSEFKDLDTLRLLPKCDHVFHPDCIDAWLSSHVTCPVCREKLDPAGSADDEVAVTVQSPSSIPNETNEENPNPTEEHAETERQHQVDHVNIVNEDEGESSVNSREDDAVSSVDDDDDDDEKQNPPLESGRGRLVELRRSNSTGHCEVELGAKNTTTERYTLRLPYDVRRYILLNHGNMMRRSASYNVIMLSEGGKRDNVERWMMSRTPPFLCRQA